MSLHTLFLVLCLSVSAQAAPVTALTPSQQEILKAITNGDRVGLQAELRKRPKLDFEDADGFPPLAHCVLANQSKMVALLTQAGADLKWKDGQARTLLHLAVTEKKTLVLDALLDAGAKVDTAGGVDAKTKRKQGVSPLGLAAQLGDLLIVKRLALRGADLNFVDARGETPLSLAKKSKRTNVVRYLEGQGATADAKEAKANPLRLKSSGAPRATTVAASAPTTAGPFGTEPGSARPAAPVLVGARPVYEITAMNVLAGGPLATLWSAFSSAHSDWKLDANGHRHDLESGVRLTQGRRITSLPTAWATELFQIGQELGYVPENLQAPFLVAPQGGTAILASQGATARAKAAAAAKAPDDDKAKPASPAKAERSVAASQAAAAAKAEATAAAKAKVAAAAKAKVAATAKAKAAAAARQRAVTTASTRADSVTVKRARYRPRS